MARNKQLLPVDDNESILEEVTYEIEPEIKKENLIEVKFLKFSKNKSTSIFVDFSGNGIEVPTQSDFLLLSQGEITKIRI
jgi:hypothetical protein